MKKIFLLLILVVSLPLMAQEKCNDPKCAIHKNRSEWFAQMRAKKLVFLVDAMDLTETEKAAFAVLFEKNRYPAANRFYPPTSKRMKNLISFRFRRPSQSFLFWSIF